MDLKVWHNPPYNRHSVISPQDISEQWQIGLKQASQTIQVMTQLGVWSALLPMAWCYREDRMFHQWCLNQWFYTDTMFSKYQSVNGNKCAQVFANNSFFIAAYPMSSKDQAGLALGKYINEFGIMKELVMDGAAEQIGKNTKMMKWIRKYHIIHHTTEPEWHNQNWAESTQETVGLQSLLVLQYIAAHFQLSIQFRRMNTNRAVDMRNTKYLQISGLFVLWLCIGPQECRTWGTNTLLVARSCTASG